MYHPYAPCTHAGTITPAQAMSRLVDFIKASQARKPNPCSWLIAWDEADIMEQARQSTERFACIATTLYKSFHALHASTHAPPSTVPFTCILFLSPSIIPAGTRKRLPGPWRAFLSW